jgi:hypothetical protein
VRTLAPRLLTPVLLSGELACGVVWALPGAIFALLVGLVVGVSVPLVALRSGGWRRHNGPTGARPPYQRRVR